jgi:hypothetical protein
MALDVGHLPGPLDGGVCFLPNHTFFCEKFNLNSYVVQGPESSTGSVSQLASVNICYRELEPAYHSLTQLDR